MAYAELPDGSLSKQLAEVTEAPKKVGDKITVTYKRLDTDPPKDGQIANVFVSGLTEELTAQLKALKVGTKTVVVKVKKGKFWNFQGLEDSTTFVAREKKPYNPGTYSGGKGQGGATKAPYDQVGAKVGGVLHDAVALAVASKAAKVTVEDVASFARDLLTLSIRLETETRVSITLEAAGNTPKPTATTTKKETVEETSTFDTEEDNIWG